MHKYKRFHPNSSTSQHYNQPTYLVSNLLFFGRFKTSGEKMHSLNLLGSFALLLSSGCHAALTTVSDWGENPTGLTMAISVPATIAESPAIILAVRFPSINRRLFNIPHSNIGFSCTRAEEQVSSITSWRTTTRSPPKRDLLPSIPARLTTPTAGTWRLRPP